MTAALLCHAVIVAASAVVAAPSTLRLTLGVPPEPHVITTVDTARERWLALARTCRGGTFPNCPAGCGRDEKYQTCVPPKPPGSLMKSIPELSDICEGYFPACPELFCQTNQVLKKCEPRLP